jgi:hypothetical protein
VSARVSRGRLRGRFLFRRLSRRLFVFRLHVVARVRVRPDILVDLVARVLVFLFFFFLLFFFFFFHAARPAPGGRPGDSLGHFLGGFFRGDFSFRTG